MERPEVGNLRGRRAGAPGHSSDVHGGEDKAASGHGRA